MAVNQRASAQGENRMRFYTKQHRHYCGIDLHARTKYVFVLDQTAPDLVHKNLRASPEELLAAVAPCRDELVIAVECIFPWYWLAEDADVHGSGVQIDP